MQRTIASDLVLLNNARARLSMPALKSWKESHAKLKDQIEKINERIKQECVTVLPVTDAGLIREAKRRAKIDAVAARILAGEEDALPEKEPVLKLPEKPKPEYRPRVHLPGTVTLADIARDLGISPKIARAKLRKKQIDFAVDKYVYPQERREDIVRILRHR